MFALEPLDFDNVVDFHRPVGNSARLVEAKHVHARKHFYAVQVLHKRLFAGKPQNGRGKRKRRQQEHARRYHAYDRARRARNDFVPVFVSGGHAVGHYVAIVRPHHKRADSDNKGRQHLYNELN